MRPRAPRRISLPPVPAGCPAKLTRGSSPRLGEVIRTAVARSERLVDGLLALAAARPALAGP